MDRTNETTLSVTYFDYRGIRVKIVHPHGHCQWCYYLYLHLKQFSDESLRKTLWVPARSNAWISVWDYSKCTFFDGLSWNGGMTFYDKHIAPNKDRVIEVGCDYDHLWDRERGYPATLQGVSRDAMATIDDIHEQTEYLIRCLGDGRLVPESEMADGGVYSKSYMASRQQQGRPRE